MPRLVAQAESRAPGILPGAPRMDGVVEKQASDARAEEKSSLSIRAMTQAMREGDESAFTIFHERYGASMYAMARRMTGRDEATCLDITQDALLRIIRSMRVFEEEPLLRAWIARVVRSAAYDHLRSERRRAQRERAHEKESNASPDPIEQAETLDRLREELRVIDRLSADALDLRVRAGWSLRRIGERLSLTPSAVDGRVRRAQGDLRERLEEDGHG